MDKMLTYKDFRIYCLVIILSLTLDRCLSQDQNTEAHTDPCGAYFVCPTRTVIPDPTDCRVRYECSGVVLTRLQCPGGQEYHSVLQLCVSAGRAACLNPCPDGFNGVRAAYDNGNIAPTVLPSPDSGVDPLVPNPGGDGPTSEEEPYKVDPCAGEFHTQCGKVTTTEYYVFSDPEDCMKYYQCLNGFFYRRDCPAGTRFDKNNHRCVHALSANCLSCPSTTERVTDPPTTPRSHGSDITDLNPCSATLAADCRSLQGEAVIPNPDNCQAYYRCENRKLRQIRCEQSQSFDDVSRSCTPPEEATCFSCQPADSTTAFPPSTLIPPLRQLNPCKTDLEATCEGYPGVSIIPDIHDCNKYFECRQGVFDSYKCDKKDIFDVESRSCTAPGQGACFRKEDCPSDEIHPCQSNQAIKAACRDAEFFSLIPDPENCRRYYECKNNNINQKMCKRGFFFDINERICLDDTIAVCVNCTVVDPCSPDIEAQCKTFGQTSDFADVTSCNAFYHCTDGQLDSRSCPAGENFDRLENVCKSAGEADCSDICSGVTTKSTESTTKGGATSQPDVSTAAPATVVPSTSPLLTTADRGGVVTDPLPSVSMGPISGTDLSTSSPAVNPCFRIEPCTPRVRVPDPEDCDKYFECEDPGRGTENPGWKRRQCTRNYSFDRILLECVDVVKKGSRCQASCPDPELSLAQVTIEPREGSIMEFQCSYYEPMSSTNPPKFPHFRWTLDGQNIRGGKGRIFITTAPATSDGYRTSHLIFNPAKYQDSGEVACRVQGTTPKAFVQSVRYDVLARPVAFVSPMTSVVPRGKIVNLFCNGSIPESGHSGAMINPTLNWYRNGRLVTKGQPETITPFHSFSNLKVEVFDDVSYSCEAVNAAGPSARMRADVFVYNVSSGDIIVFCKEELADNVMWPRTSAGIEVRSGCPTGMIGVAVRRCNEVDDDVDDDEDHVEAEWGPPNLIGCVTREVTELLERSKNIEEGVGSDNSSFIANLVYDIEYNTDKSGIIPPGDISATVETVDYLAVVRQENADTTDLMYEELQAMVNIVSNLIDDMNEESWSVLQSSEADMHKGIDLMRAVDGYADVMAGQTQLIGLLSAMSKNLMLQVECILKNETGTLVYPRRGKEETIWLGDQHDQISLEKNTLNSIMNKVRGKSMAFASAYYKGLSSVIPDSAEYGEIGSNILSLSIARLLGVKNLDPPVRLEMNIDKALVDQNLTARCGFWDFSKGVRGNWSTEGCEVVYSNDSFASCQCDHLTNFAILMSTHKPDDKHAEILSIITTVGLIVSLVCLVLTIGLYCVLWNKVVRDREDERHIKSHHAVVLINLCIALIIANVLFLAGVHQTKIKLMCTIISVLLHYFYLAAFFIMLVEGIQLLLYVVFVFHVRRKRETTMLLIFGWFLPAAVVGASLGITKMEGYGNEYFCWLDIDSGLIWAFVGPVLCIIFVNIIILIVVLRRASASNANLRIEKKKRHRIRSSFWNIVVITPIVGVAWIFGVFAVNQDTLAFQYIFAIFNSLQGLLIFIFHGIFNKRVQDKIQTSFRSRTTNSNSITLAIRSMLPGKIFGKKPCSPKSSFSMGKGRYSVKHPSTKRSRLKSDTSGKNANKVNKNSKGSSVPSSPGTEPPNLFPMKTEGDNKDTLSELREDNHMSWRNSNVFYSNGMSTFGGSDISNQTNSTLVNSTESNGTQPHTTSNSESQDSGVGVSSADIKADIKETERPDPREPVQRVLSSTSC